MGTKRVFLYAGASGVAAAAFGLIFHPSSPVAIVGGAFVGIAVTLISINIWGY